jgi:signal transduction histidine kinase
VSWTSVQESWKRVSGSTKEALGGLARNARQAARVAVLAPGREQTDESLRQERSRADEALADGQERAGQNADAIVDRARHNADSVLSAARENADAVLQSAREKADWPRGPQAGPSGSASLHDERKTADDAVRDERAAADEVLSEEREHQARAMHAFLPLERVSTDDSLRSERSRSDDAIVNRDDFLAIVTHDLRDLLGGIATSSAVLAARAPTGEDGRNTLTETRRIGRYVARMNRLIGDLVDVVSIDAGKLAVRRESGDATELITEAVDAFGNAARDKGISLESLTSGTSLPAVFDRERMLQVLANLITNAIKFTARGGVVTVRGEDAEEELRVSVLDTGTGIPADILEMVFERFWQVGKNDRRGLGLGLYISRCIVEAHGGRIWAESKLGTGSAFHFTIPLSARAAPWNQAAEQNSMTL